MDDIFQAVGLERAETYIKSLLNLIEYPPGEYEDIVVLVTSSEGVSRERLGRHRWATFRILWNMSRKGFEELYNAIPGEKPSFEEIWEWVSGNLRYIEKLVEARWDVDKMVSEIIESKGLRKFVAELSDREKEVLEESLGGPDALLKRIRDAPKLVDRLIELNLVVEMFDRDPYFWIDEPLPERSKARYRQVLRVANTATQRSNGESSRTGKQAKLLHGEPRSPPPSPHRALREIIARRPRLRHAHS